MSNLLKRTLALALIFCLVLSVIPAVSADEPAATVDKVTYSFTNSTSIGYHAITEDMGKGWYYLGSSLAQGGGGVVANKGICFNPTNETHWYAMVLTTPANLEEAAYDFTFTQYGGYCKAETIIVEATETLINKLKDTNEGTGTSVGNDADDSVTGEDGLFAVVDYTLTAPGRVGWDTGIAFLGSMELKADTDYILLTRPVQGQPKPAGGNYYINLLSLQLTKTGATGSANGFLQAMKTDKVAGGATSTDTGNYAQLCNDFVCSDNVVLNKNTFLELAGHSFTAASLTATASNAHVVDVTNGDGSLVLTAGAPVLKADNGAVQFYKSSGWYVKRAALLTLNAGTNTYKFAAPTVTLADALQTPVDAENDNAIVFNVTLPKADNYTYVDEDIEIALTLQVGENEAKTYYFSDNGDAENANQVAAWAANAGAGDKLFYADLNNLEAIAGETLSVTAQISWNNVVISATADYVIPAAE